MFCVFNSKVRDIFCFKKFFKYVFIIKYMKKEVLFSILLILIVVSMFGVVLSPTGFAIVQGQSILQTSENSKNLVINSQEIRNIDDSDMLNKFTHLRGYKDISFDISSSEDFDAVEIEKINIPSNNKDKVENIFRLNNLEVETEYKKVDTSFFNIDERPVKQTYILKNLLNDPRDVKLNIKYEIDASTITWNSTEYEITNEPIYFEAFEVTEEIFPGLNETFLTGHTLYFDEEEGISYYDFKDVVNLDYTVSVYSKEDKNYIDLEVNSNINGLEEFVIDPEVGWTTRIIATSADSGESVFAIDIDNDDDIDVLSASQNDDKIAWYENDGGSPPSWTARTITTSANGAVEVFAIDIDNDDDIDVLSASYWDDKIAWYENDGGSPPSWTTRTITTSADSARFVYAIDIDNDNDIDVLSASYVDNKIAWYENDGGSPPSWTSYTITTSASGAEGIFAIDLDEDNDIDVLSASILDGKIAWYENDGSESFTAHNITTSANGAYSVFAIDLDDDGDLDVLSASAFDDKIAWYENDGSESFTSRTITTSADYASSVYAVDVDLDGDIDVLSASGSDNKIAWYENDGGSPPSWTTRTITTSAIWSRSVYAADVDLDGDIDVLSASSSDDKIAWYESNLDPNVTIKEIIPIQVVENVDLVKGKTTLVRAVINNSGPTNENILVKLYFNGNLKDSTTDTINAGQEKDIDLWFVPDVAGSNKEIKVEVEEV